MTRKDGRLRDTRMLKDAGYEAGLAGSPCEAPTTSELARGTWEQGWRAGHKQRLENRRNAVGRFDAPVQEIRIRRLSTGSYEVEVTVDVPAPPTQLIAVATGLHQALELARSMTVEPVEG